MIHPELEQQVHDWLSCYGAYGPFSIGQEMARLNDMQIMHAMKREWRVHYSDVDIAECIARYRAKIFYSVEK